MKITSKIKYLLMHYEYFTKSETWKMVGKKDWVDQESFDFHKEEFFRLVGYTKGSIENFKFDNSIEEYIEMKIWVIINNWDD